MKKLIYLSSLLLALLLFAPCEVKAASGNIIFSTDTPQPIKGQTFTVVCQVTSPSGFVDADFYIVYDSSHLSFKEGGSKVSGGHGLLHVSSTGNDTQVTKRTFSLQFKAKKTGGAVIDLSDTASVKDSDNAQVSISSNQLSVEIVNQGTEMSTTTSPTPEVKSNLSTNNKLEKLSLTAVAMTPEFDPAVKEYAVTVDCNTTTLFYSFKTVQKDAKVVVSNNEDLKEGTTPVTIVVTSAAGKNRRYTLNVTKESASQTAEREKNEEKQQEKSGVNFQVNSADGTITLNNSIDFTVLPVENETTIPSGYVATNMEFDGIKVPVYAMESDPDNEFVLMYLQGPNGSAAIYQFDRTERTIQRYTGTMIEKINKNGASTQNSNSNTSSTVFYVIIAILTLVILGLLTTMVKMALIVRKQKRKNNSQSTHQELDL